MVIVLLYTWTPAIDTVSGYVPGARSVNVTAVPDGTAAAAAIPSAGRQTSPMQTSVSSGIGPPLFVVRVTTA